MTGQNRPVYITQPVQVGFIPGKIVSVTVVNPAVGAKLELYNNADGSGNPFYTVDGSVIAPNTELWIPYRLLYAKRTGGATYNLIVN